MLSLRDTPIRRKLSMAAMIPCAVGLLCATLLLVQRQTSRARQRSEDEVRVLAQVIADTSSAALAFGDAATATEILGSLTGHPSVLFAQLLDGEGASFAEYRSPAARGIRDLPPRTDGLHDTGDAILVYQPVDEKDHRLGTLIVEFSLGALAREQRKAIQLAGIGLLAALGIAFLLSTLIQRMISRPILRLAATTRAVRQSDDYSLRAEKSGEDEIGFLIDSFNAMLARVEAREQELAESRERFELAVRGTSDGIWDWEVPSHQIWFSDQFKHLLGYAPDELADEYQSFESHLHADDREATRLAVEAHVSRGEPFDVEFRLRTQSGEHRWYRARATSVRDAKGEAVRMVGSIQDVTEAKLARHERERLLSALAAKNRELEQIIYVTSHDLRSPLVNIQGFGSELKHACKEMLERLPGRTSADSSEVQRLATEEIPEMLGFIQRSAAKMERLLAGLLKLSRSGRAALEPREVDMNELIQGVLAEFEYVAKEQSVSLMAGELPGCWADEIQINQVFANLLNNAIKYLDPERPGEIRISGAREGGRSLYVIEDNGVGIPKSHQEKIFEVFHRLDPDRGEGEGLGLTIVRRSLERQHGSIWLDSEPGVGTRFFVAMPAQAFRIEDLMEAPRT
jgi:PAS domain S-box-containing protein